MKPNTATTLDSGTRDAEALNDAGAIECWIVEIACQAFCQTYEQDAGPIEIAVYERCVRQCLDVDECRN